MNSKALTALLLVASAILGGMLFLNTQKAKEQKETLIAQRNQVSNSWVQASAKLTEQTKVNIVLETNLAKISQDLLSSSNDVFSLSNKLNKTEAEAAQAALTAKEEMAKRDAKITELEKNRDDLTKRMMELNGSIEALEKQITDTESKLASAEGDKEFLIKELKRLQAEKAELERQFNNLGFLREQVRKLRDELSVTRRLEWIRRGLYGNEKGAEKLNKGFTSPGAATNFNLNVELHQDGTVVNKGQTNAPAAPTNAPAK